MMWYIWTILLFFNLFWLTCAFIWYNAGHREWQTFLTGVGGASGASFSVGGLLS